MGEFIQLNNLKHIVVPRKWLYRLPKKFFDSETGEASYILIVEKMNICGGKSKHNGETAKKYKRIDYPTLRELCIAVYYFRGLDSAPCNLPFTHNNKIAFVDTECWDEWNREGFLARIFPYVNLEHQLDILAILEQLCEQERKFICKECENLSNLMQHL